MINVTGAFRLCLFSVSEINFRLSNPTAPFGPYQTINPKSPSQRGVYKAKEAAPDGTASCQGLWDWIILQ